MSNFLLDALSTSQRERLAFIEFRLWFLGKVSRKDVLERFDIATAAGTRDLVLYKELAPNNLIYIGKSYQYDSDFKPIFQHQPERVLSALTSGFGDGERGTDYTLLPNSVPARLNQPPLRLLATITRAIHNRRPLKLIYHSMKTGANPREIVPLALVDSGLRWHVRAFDRTKNEFRDLVLTRMEKLSEFNLGDKRHEIQTHEDLQFDKQWQEIVELNLVPHPSHPHPESIMRDYGMVKGALRVKTRAASAGYVLRQWQVDCSNKGTLSGAEFRLLLSNKDALMHVDSLVLAPGFEL